MTSAKRLFALVCACACAYAAWQVYGLPDFIYSSFSIGRRSLLAEQYLGFLSIIATFAINCSFLMVICACLHYALSPNPDQAFETTCDKTKRVAFKLMLGSRLAGLFLVFAGLLVWFLAYLVPGYVVEQIYWWRPGYGLRTMVGMTSVAFMFAGAAAGLFITVGGGALVLVPAHIRNRK